VEGKHQYTSYRFGIIKTKKWEIVRTKLEEHEAPSLVLV